MSKPMISMLAAAALLLSLAACGNQDAQDTADAKREPNTSYTGTVTAISTQSITLSADTGEVTIPLTDATAFGFAFGMGGQMPGNMGQIPDGMGQNPADMEELLEGTGTLGELPADGEGQGSMQTPPEGMDNSELPEMPEGEASGGAAQGGTLPELPEGESAQNGIDPMTQNATIAAVYIGASVTVETDDSGSAATVTVSGGDMAGLRQFGNMDGRQQPGDMGQMPGGMNAGDDAASEFTDDGSQSGAEQTPADDS